MVKLMGASALLSVVIARLDRAIQYADQSHDAGPSDFGACRIKTTKWIAAHTRTTAIEIPPKKIRNKLGESIF